MKKKTQILLITLWGLAVAGSRIWYLLLKWQSAVDTYEYFANAMIQAEKTSIPLTSGLAYAYTKSLSDLLLFAGNRLEAVCVYQMVLQILWIAFFFAGISMIFGKISGIVSSTVLAVLPMTFNSMIDPSTENFYMLHLSLNLIVLGAFCLQAQKAVWYERKPCELYLLTSGFYMGVICIWNYAGFLLLLVTGYILIRNHFVLKEMIKAQKSEVDRKPGDQIMSVGSQGFLIFAGMLAGMFFMLMKYTGLTGYAFIEQFEQWRGQMADFPERCQDISTWFVIAFPCSVLTGILCQGIFANLKKSEAIEKEEMECRKEECMEETQDGYITTEDGRKIRLLDNPLPVPKRHVRKEMGFDFEFDDIPFKEKEKDARIDFDVEIDADDDFDLN